ncbi:hypothetical protein L0F63_004728 [Massospora cicadina]|nr:hypothetical protein L0F63_004728 [Massospora cicadina]
MSQLNSIPELTVTRTQTGESLTQPEVEPSDPHNSEDEEAQELEHFYAVVMAFRYYGYSSVQDLNLRKRYFDELTRSKPDQVRFLSKLYYAKLREVGRALQANAHFLGLVVEDHDIFHNDNRVGLKDLPLKVPPQDHMDKVATTLRMLVRDWSDRVSCKSFRGSVAATGSSTLNLYLFEVWVKSGVDLVGGIFEANGVKADRSIEKQL